MKKNIKLNGKLSFNKETIAKLNDNQMSKIEGGSDVFCTNGCTVGCPTYPRKNCAILITEDCTPTR